MYSFPITVLLAFGSALTRRAVGAVLRRDAGVAIVGETDNVAAVARMVATLMPDVILCDETLAFDAGLALQPAGKLEVRRPRLVLVTTNPTSVKLNPGSTIVAVLPLNLPAHEWSRRLASALTTASTPPPPPRPVTGMQDRFTIMGHTETEVAVPDQPPSAPDPAPGVSTQPLPTVNRVRDEPNSPVRTSRLERRATPYTQQALLHVTQRLIPGSRDATTGLATVRVLDLAMLELPRLNLPAAVLMVGVQFPQQQPLDAAAVTPVLRLVSALLRANVRQGDLVCFLDRMAFAVVMLSIDEVAIVEPLGRIREALSDLKSLGNQDAAPRAALGVGFWKPGTAIEYTVRSAWQAMVRERGSTN